MITTGILFLKMGFLDSSKDKPPEDKNTPSPIPPPPESRSRLNSRGNSPVPSGN